MGWASWVPLITAWPWWGHNYSCETHMVSSSHSSLYTLCASLPRLRGPGGDFSPYQHFPVSDLWTARPSKEICLICCVCKQGFDCLDFWVNTTAYAPLLGYCYFTYVVSANIDPYIWLQCRIIRNQAESSFFLSWPFILISTDPSSSAFQQSFFVFWPYLITFFQYSFLFDFLLQKHVYPDIVDNYRNPSCLSTDFSVFELVNQIKNSGFIAVVSRTPDRQMRVISEEITPL